MMNIHELRYGNHILCGSLAEYIPKQISRVGTLRRDLVSTQIDAQHPDLGEYTATECEGVEISPAILLRNGWVQSRLNDERYFYAQNGERFVWDSVTRYAQANAENYAERSGVRYLHQLENVIIDSGSRYTFNLWEER